MRRLRGVLVADGRKGAVGVHATRSANVEAAAIRVQNLVFAALFHTVDTNHRMHGYLYALHAMEFILELLLGGVDHQ